MALQKNIISSRTGVTLGYHEVAQVSFGNGKATVLVTSYPSKAVKDAGKSFVEAASNAFDYAGEAIANGVVSYAQDKLLTLPEYAGATVVA